MRLGNISITIEPAILNLSPVGFRIWARHYRKCEGDFRSPDRFSPVPYFLLCRAMELQLKAHYLESLRQKDVKDRFGHDLIEAYRSLPTASQILTAAEVDVLTAANDIYKGKGFEYFSGLDAATGYNRFPDLIELRAIADKLMRNGV